VIKLIKRASKVIGIDGAIAFTLLSRIIQAGGGIVSLFFIAKCLTTVEQGYYYTFGSILAIQVFFELGLEAIIAQFVAHENAKLVWNDKVSFGGSEEAASRLSSLLRFTVKWFGVIAVLLFGGLLISGYFFFGKFGKIDAIVEWQIPWLIMAFTTSLSLMLSPILSFFEGLGMIKDVAKIRFFQQIVQFSILYTLFSLGFKLYSSPIAAIAAFSILPIWIILSSKIKLLTFIWHKLGEWKVNYRLEIFPYQWKIALSWISGYFIFQLFNPVLFATEGPVVAGQMGMTLTVLNSIFALSFSWISTKVPIFSGLIAQKEYAKLDHLFKKTLIQSSALNVLMLGVLFSLIFILRYFDIKIGGKNFGDRFLPFLPLLFMMIPIMLNHIIGSMATYLRCHKKEPMLVQSIIIGILCSLSTIVFGKYYGVIGITMGYMLLTIGSLVWTYITFNTMKKEWHN
jgi:O-antigen/teichoic acid export membrane protein